jgi:hypothetical protein
MIENRERRLRWNLLAGLIAAIMLFLPIEITVVPAWEVKVVDEAGNPMKDIIVRESWQFYSVESRNHEDEALTDKEGHVDFPARSMRTNLLWIIWGLIKYAARLGIHASFGPDAFIIAWDKQSGQTTLIDYWPYLFGSPPKQIILKRQN